MGLPVHADHVRAGVDFHPLGERVNELFHRLEVGVGAQVLELGLAHVQVVFEAAFLELVARLEPLGCRAEFDEDLIRLLDVIEHRLIGEELGEPAAVFGTDHVFAVRKGARAREPLHDGAGFALDTGAHLFGDDRADALFDGAALFKQRDRKGGRAFRKAPRGHQAADAAADDGDVILLFHVISLLCFVCAGAPGRRASPSGGSGAFCAARCYRP